MKKRFQSFLMISLLFLCYLLTACSTEPPRQSIDDTSEQMVQYTEVQAATAATSEMPSSSEATQPPLPFEPEWSGEVDFRYIYRGFTAVSLNDREMFEKFMGFGTQIIATEEEWDAFMASYCPGIPYYEPWDFSEDYLLASIVLGTSPTYAGSNSTTRLFWENGRFLPEFENNPANYVYAMNTAEYTHFFVEVMAVSKAAHADEGAENQDTSPEETQIKPAAGDIRNIFRGFSMVSLDSPKDVDRILAYTTYFHEWMPGSFGSDAYSPYYEMKFLDLNEDGLDEMVIWKSTTGIVYEVVTFDNGQTVPLYSGSIFKMDEYEEEMYLCQDNTLEKFYPNPLQGQQIQEYYRVEDQNIVMVECIMQNQDNRWYWSESDGASDAMWTEISESEAQAVQNSHVRIEVKQVSPISEETKARDKAEAEERLQLVLKDQYPIHFYEAVEDHTLSGYCAKESERLGFSVGITRYALLDMDGDGISEGVVDFRFGENEQVMCLVLKYEQSGVMSATVFYYRQMYQLKSDGTFAASGSEDTDGWYRLRWENMSWVTETVSDEENCESKPDAPWQTYEPTQIKE